jgi:hypothetical protein
MEFVLLLRWRPPSDKREIACEGLDHLIIIIIIAMAHFTTESEPYLYI